MAKRLKQRPKLTFERYASIEREMSSYRRLFYHDAEVFKMSSFWRDLSEDVPTISLKLHSGSGDKAGSIVFDEMITIIAPEAMFDRAEKGQLVPNFILGHEFGHVALGHHDNSKVVKNFQLFDTESGRANVPPTIEELEANVASVFFQCGEFLYDEGMTDFEVARRCYSDPHTVGIVRRKLKAQQFRKAKDLLSNSIRKVVL